jgi:chromate reductase
MLTAFPYVAKPSTSEFAKEETAMIAPKILAFAGSIRRGSFNHKLLRIAGDGAAAAGADVTVIDLADYELPLFNEDLEREATPENATKLKQLFLRHDALLIGSPEYNSSLTPLLKNTLDWVSRASSDIPALAAYRGKVAGLVAASPGALGGLRGLVHVRSILSSIGVIVLPDQVAVPKAHEAFDDRDQLADAKMQEKALGFGRQLATTTKQLMG